MAITKLTLSKSGYRSFWYLAGRNAEEPRYLDYDTIGVIPGSMEYMFNQFKKVWKRADKENRYAGDGTIYNKDGGTAHIQAIRTVTSFSEEDFPRQPGGGYTDEQVAKALEMTRTAHERMGYKQAVLFAQCDGKGGYLHVHGFVQAVDPITHKTLTGKYVYYNRLRAISDEVLKENGLTPLEKSGRNILTTEERYKRDDKIPKDTVLFDEDLKNKIYEVLDEGFVSRDEFVSKLDKRGVEVKFREDGDGITYLMNDRTHKNNRKRRRKASKLGPDFMALNIDAVMEVSKAKAAEESGIFTEADARKLESLEAMLKGTSEDSSDLVVGLLKKDIEKLEAKRDGKKPKKEKKKADVAEAAPEVTEEVEPAIKVSTKKAPEKRKKPEDEIHEVPDVKPLDNPYDNLYYKSGLTPPWLERKEEALSEDYEEEEIIESEEEVTEVEMTEEEKEKAEALKRAARHYIMIRDGLNSLDGVEIFDGVTEKIDDKSMEK